MRWCDIATETEDEGEKMHNKKYILYISCSQGSKGRRRGRRKRGVWKLSRIIILEVCKNAI